MFASTYPGGFPFLFRLVAAFGLACCWAAVALAQAPVITTLSSPRQTVTLGQSLTLSASASGATSYQWKRRGLPIAGATGASYTLTAAQPARDTGWYQIVATNASGSTASAAVFVNVVVPTTQSLGWGYFTDLYPPALANVSAVGLSQLHGLAVLSDGTLFRWGGSMSPALSAPPPGLSGVVAVAASWLHTLALKSDGTVVAWGSYNFDVSPVTAGPVAGLTNVVAISDAFAHSMALRRDGTVAVWTAGTLPAELAVPAGLVNVVSISAGLDYCLAAKSDGTVVGWGKPGKPGSLVPVGLTDVVSVHAGMDVAAALKSDGTVVAWGNSASTPPAGLSGVVAIAAGESHFYAVKNDGHAVFWGTVTRWGLTSPSTEFSNVQFVASAEYNVVGVGNAAGLAAPAITVQPVTVSPGLGATVTFSVTATGTAPLTYQWQRRAAGTADFVNVPYKPAVYAGDSTAVLTVTGTTAAMRGDAFRCIVSNGIAPGVTSAVAELNVSAPPLFTSAAQAVFGLGQPGSFFVTATGAPAPTFSLVAGDLPGWASFDGATGELVGTPPSTSGSPWVVTLAADNGVGDPVTQVLTLSAVEVPVFQQMSPPRQTVVSGRSLTLSGQVSGAVSYQWRRNGRPLAGATSRSLTLTDARIWRDAGWYQLVAANAQGATSIGPVVFVNVVATPGFVLQLGSGSGDAPPTDLTNVAAVRNGVMSHALRGDGRVASWGWDPYVIAPALAALTEVVAVEPAGSGWLALRSDGTLVGGGPIGSLGAQVPAGLDRVVRCVAGNYHVLVLRSDGSLVAWGQDYAGQTTPPAGLGPVVDIAVGDAHSVALRADGTVVAWGSNSSNQCAVPAGLTDVAAVYAKGNRTVVLTTDGRIIEWGSLLGWVSPPSTTPKPVALSLGYDFSLALRADGTVVAWGNTGADQAAIPAGTTRIADLSAGGNLSLLLRDDTVNAAPTITAAPTVQTKDLNQTATFTVVATGTAPLVYTWQRQAAGTTGFADLEASSVYSGVATATLTVAGTAAPMNGDQFRCVVSNGIGAPATSAAATLLVSSPPAFTGAATATFFINRAVAFTVTAAGTPAPTFSAAGLPAWITLNSTTGVLTGTAPDATGAPWTFTVTATNGIGAPVTQTFTLQVRAAHSADVSPADGSLNLAELTRVIELYNTRTGTLRTGRYVTAAGTVDGYAPDPGVTAGPIPTTPHTADLNRDGRLSLPELTRVIELFNTRSGPTRTGAYHSAATPAATEDGFAPGP